MREIELKTIENLNKLGRPVVRKLLKDWDFAGELQEWSKTVAVKRIPFTTTHKWNEDRNHKRFHPSSLKYPCDMRLFFQLIGEREVLKKHPQQAVFDMGTAVHLMMNYYMHTMAISKNFVYNDEVPLWKASASADKYQLCGSTDGVMERTVTINETQLHLRATIDWKSINSSGFSSLRDSVGSDYEKQMHGYMISGNIPVTFVVYVNKDNSVFKSIPVMFSPAIWDPIADRLSRIIQITNEMKEPMKTIGTHCSGCPYVEECEPEGFSAKRRRNSTPRFAT